MNTAAVWSLDRLGASNVTAWAHTLGIQSKLGADLSLALGSYEVTPREMAGAYAAFAAGGVYDEPILIQKIVGPSGARCRCPIGIKGRRVMEESEAYVITSLLTSVVQEGTAKRAKQLGRPIAARRGRATRPRTAGSSATRPTSPAPCGPATTIRPRWAPARRARRWRSPPSSISCARPTRSAPPADFPVPGGIVRVMIDPASGLRAYPDQKDAIEEIFLSGTEPTEVADAGAPAAGDARRAPLPETPARPHRRDAGAEPWDAGSLDKPSEAPPF